MEITAWIILRVVYAWMFLYPLKMLLSDWNAAKDTVAILIPWQRQFFTVLMIAVMVIGALSILLGFYPRIGGLLLLIYCLLGALVHYRLAAIVTQQKLTASASNEDQAVLDQTVALGQVGHISSAQKNFVLAAVALFFVLMGTGPLSLLTLF